MKAKTNPASLLILVLALTIPSTANGKKCPPDLDRCPAPELPATLSVKMYRNFLVVAEGHIGDAPEPQKFLIDTGTSPSILNAKLIKQLGLPVRSSEVAALGTPVATLATVLPKIQLGPIRAFSFPVQVHDLSQLERDLGVPIAGILGMDLLSKASFHLDYEKLELEFGSVPHEGIPISLDPRTGIALAKVKLGLRNLRLVVDTGSDSLVLLGGNFADTGWLSLKSASESGNGVASKEMSLQEFPVPELTFGGQHFSKETAYLIPRGADPGFDGLLGVRALGFRGLSYDQSTGNIYLQK